MAKNTSKKQYELLRFNKQFMYLDEDGEQTKPTATVTKSLEFSGSESITFDIKVISDDIYLFYCEIKASGDNDVARMVRYQVENEIIIPANIKSFDFNAE